jgi:hypothetical protein
MLSCKKAGDVVVNEQMRLKQDIPSVDQIVDDLTLFDDDLMSMVFDGNIEATELLLKIILKMDDIKVISVVGQRELENPIVKGRNIRLDILAEDSTGRYIDIEVQRSNEGTHFKRARFHSSMLDVRMLKAGQKFKEMMDSYVIFITENDVVGFGLPQYHVERIIEETKEFFCDGSHIIYVNGSYNGNDPVGRLIHDFKCKESKDMYYKEFSKGVRHFKETKGGRQIMCQAVEEYADQKAKEAAKEAAKLAKEEANIETIKNLINKKHFSLEEAMDIIGAEGEEKEMLVKKFG